MEPEVIVVQYGRGCWTCDQKEQFVFVYDSDLTLSNSYEDGTSTNRELRQAYKTAEVGNSQLWAQPWVMLAYELLNRTGNGFNIKVFVLLNKSKPALAQTQVSK